MKSSLVVSEGSREGRAAEKFQKTGWRAAGALGGEECGPVVVEGRPQRAAVTSPDGF